MRLQVSLQLLDGFGRPAREDELAVEEGERLVVPASGEQRGGAESGAVLNWVEVREDGRDRFGGEEERALDAGLAARRWCHLVALL